MYQYENLLSWLAMNASNCTAETSAYARAARGGIVEPIFRHPLVHVAVDPRVQALRALPVERLVVGPEC